MKKILTGLCLLPLLAYSQNFHFATRLGFAGYQGDLKQAKKALTQLNLFGSLGAQYDLTEHITARSYFSLTKVQGDDKRGNASMQKRNLNFQSKLSDWELTAQYNLYSLNDKWWTPYVFTGIGFFHFNPYTKDPAGNKAYLKPLSTEGEGFAPGSPDYKLTQFCLPIGFGATCTLGEDMRLGIEAGYRKTFTDYLDDVSRSYVDETSLSNARGSEAVTLAYRGNEVGSGPYPKAGTLRGNDRSKDGYYYIAITFSIRYWFDKYKQIAGMPSMRKDKRVGCPASRGF
ncbi:MAG: DUF6089 family protein [Flavisolibacter sp.]